MAYSATCTYSAHFKSLSFLLRQNPCVQFCSILVDKTTCERSIFSHLHQTQFYLIIIESSEKKIINIFILKTCARNNKVSIVKKCIGILCFWDCVCFLMNFLQSGGVWYFLLHWPIIRQGAPLWHQILHVLEVITTIHDDHSTRKSPREQKIFHHIRGGSLVSVCVWLYFRNTKKISHTFHCSHSSCLPVVPNLLLCPTVKC